MKKLWDERYAIDEYFYGTQANDFLVSQSGLLASGQSCLAVADGEGRNGVWLAEQGLQVRSLDYSNVAQLKAQKLARQRRVSIDFEQADLLQWNWGENRFDIVVGIFVQFVSGAQRDFLFEQMQRCLKPSGLLLLQGYTPRQLEFKTGGPSQIENLYTEEILRGAFSELDVLHLCEHDAVIREGVGHNGMSALIDFVGRKT
ncbi:MAG: class I SAM-dependent methyltransferase [Gallionellaceae bacterium]|jgi:cyclopropane fatty-acyl-phospholipid synthase-like methyltransferase